MNGDLDPDQFAQIPTTDFQFLSKPDDILKIAREAIHADAVSRVRRGPGNAVASMWLTVPWDSPMGKFIPRKGSAVVETAVNEALEAKARQWIAAGERIQKINGVQVLSHFKSEENIAALKPLLADPDAQYRLQGPDTITSYPVRTAALEALRSWGVEATTVTSEKASTRKP